MATITEPDRILACAQAAHEANRAYCAGIGDEWQVPWEQAPQWQRDSAIGGVRGVLKGNTPEQSHESWLKEKTEAGWKHGPVRDPDKKEHPCFMPYAELPPEQKMKDEIFVATVRSMYAALGGKLKFDSGEPENVVDAINRQTYHVPHQLDLFAAGFAREIVCARWRESSLVIGEQRSFTRADALQAYAWAIDMLDARRQTFDDADMEAI